MYSLTIVRANIGGPGEDAEIVTGARVDYKSRAVSADNQRVVIAKIINAAQYVFSDGVRMHAVSRAGDPQTPGRLVIVLPTNYPNKIGDEWCERLAALIVNTEINIYAPVGWGEFLEQLLALKRDYALAQGAVRGQTGPDACPSRLMRVIEHAVAPTQRRSAP